MAEAARTALVIIDVQNDFLPPDGSLAVKDGLAVIPVINQLRKNEKFNYVFMTQDFHPPGHVSFHETHKAKGAKMGEPFKLENGEMQVMWPTHCVQGTKGCQFHAQLTRKDTDIVVQKGYLKHKDSYSGFGNPELHKQLAQRGVKTVYLCGLAFDFCVGNSALDAAKLGYSVVVIEDATRPVAAESAVAMHAKLNKAGVRIVQAAKV